jgi:hypothetical protein
MIELKQEEYNELLKLKSQYVTMKEENEKLQNENKEVKDENAEIKKESEEVKKENEELKENEKEAEKEKVENLKNEATLYINDKIKDGYLKPAHKDRYVKEYVEYKKDEKLFNDFKDDIEGRTKIINFSPTDYQEGNTNATFNFKKELEETEFKAGATINYEELQKKIDMVMKAEGITFEQACIKCGVTNPNEFGDAQEGGE